ncbi:MAG: UbiA family prenyltransferase [Hyphomonadaceae bacterium]|nr:UbiA family prenyltransferase [Hyphomonadaceae bacterium]
MAEQQPVALDPRPLAARLWTYQAQRFPLTSQGALIVLFALSCVCFGALTRLSPAPPGAESVIVAIVVVFLFFFQLRVADEHRDYDEDVRARPWLPVPKGVITLPELDIFAVGAMAAQAVLTVALHPPLLALLFGPWLWIFLVRNDFFARETLARRPLASLTLHLAFFPLVALYAIAADQLPVAGALSPGLAAFLLLAALCAAAIEFARKCLAPEQEKRGVVTYSKLWGPRAAGMTAAFALVGAILFALLAFIATRAQGFLFLPAVGAGFFAFFAAARYAQSPTAAHASRLLGWTAGWIAIAYASVGILPLFVRHVGDVAS